MSNNSISFAGRDYHPVLLFCDFSKTFSTPYLCLNGLVRRKSRRALKGVFPIFSTSNYAKLLLNRLFHPSFVQENIKKPPDSFADNSANFRVFYRSITAPLRIHPQISLFLNTFSSRLLFHIFSVQSEAKKR
jgi:hypothetical protein